LSDYRRNVNQVIVLIIKSNATDGRIRPQMLYSMTERRDRLCRSGRSGV